MARAVTRFPALSAPGSTESGSGLFQCPDGRYILEESLCDGVNDCNDEEATDELNCTSK